MSPRPCLCVGREEFSSHSCSGQVGKRVVGLAALLGSHYPSAEGLAGPPGSGFPGKPQSGGGGASAPCGSGQ